MLFTFAAVCPSDATVDETVYTSDLAVFCSVAAVCSSDVATVLMKLFTLSDLAVFGSVCSSDLAVCCSYADACCSGVVACSSITADYCLDAAVCFSAATVFSSKAPD